MKTRHLLSTLTTLFLFGMGLAACDKADEDSPTGRSCEGTAAATATCGDEDTLAYCGYIEGAKEYGPCIPAEELECEPGDWKNVPDPNASATDDEDLCPGTDYACEVMGGVPMWIEQGCDTPLVLRFDAQPVEMIAAESTPAATFDISMRDDSCITTDWPSAATPWLVVDLDHSGTIDGGHELFGSGTRLANGSHANHGFAALAEFDDNRDGVVDLADSRFAELLLWRDWDADRKATPDELEPLSMTGIEHLALDFEIRTECDDRGNCGVQRAGFEHAGGIGEIVDLYLACH